MILGPRAAAWHEQKAPRMATATNAMLADALGLLRQGQFAQARAVLEGCTPSPMSRSCWRMPMRGATACRRPLACSAGRP
ncbi:hypothetical protein RI056_16455 [Komagataeibacter nataicola]|uniref:hypothetical protein n=1 Tax=Komagataeibacter nataicola TaxID=265960 RepID=UPI0028B060DC|nr:hypothetical protein [Komagataeibacter nataicola]WNM08425.1 hypothetical protein RI056_16455 [Komagataeibacter nataicola]